MQEGTRKDPELTPDSLKELFSVAFAGTSMSMYTSGLASIVRSSCAWLLTEELLDLAERDLREDFASLGLLVFGVAPSRDFSLLDLALLALDFGVNLGDSDTSAL